jgi:nogalonic acid methyl ester cyclase / aklanonic acid methyl ester cyclase
MHYQVSPVNHEVIPMTKDTVSPVRRMFEAFNTRDLSRADEFVSADDLNHEALDDEDERSKRRGPAEFKASVNWLCQAHSDLHFEEQELVAAGDKVVVRTVMSGKHTGEFMGIPPTGKRLAVQQLHIFRIASGKVAEHRAVRDDFGDDGTAWGGSFRICFGGLAQVREERANPARGSGRSRRSRC